MQMGLHFELGQSQQPVVYIEYMYSVVLVKVSGMYLGSKEDDRKTV